jgi:hypothetical protein
VASRRAKDSPERFEANTQIAVVSRRKVLDTAVLDAHRVYNVTHREFMGIDVTYRKFAGPAGVRQRAAAI